jgi:hypothetical protein
MGAAFPGRRGAHEPAGILRRRMGGTALLFWFYSDLPVCRNRLHLLRRDNPGVRIYGVYGGEAAHEARFRDALTPLLDDFWAFPRAETPKWKYRHGDLVLAQWYADRGRELEWDHVFVAQWDLLMLAPLHELLPPLRADDVLLSGVSPVADVEHEWVWVRGGHEPTYRAFVTAMQARFGAVEPTACLFVIACLPRRLLAAYADAPDLETGYVEYRLPTLAKAIGLRVVEHERFGAWSPADGRTRPAQRRRRFLNGSRRPVHLPTVLGELARSDGARLFHPYHGLFPATPRWAARAPAWAIYATTRAGRKAVTARTAKLRARTH